MAKGDIGNAVVRSSGARRRARGCAAITAAAGLLWLSACAGDGGVGVSKPTSQVSASDFVTAVGEPGSPAKPVESTRPVGTDRTAGVVQASKGIADARAVTGEPAASASSAEAAAARKGPGAPAAAASERASAVVEVLVGQINGRPVYASEFFAPMDARLRAQAKQLTRPRWFDEMRKTVRQALIDKMRDELLLAEFESSLTPEARRGVLAFVNDLRGNVVRGFTGSSDLANRRLLEQEGITLDEKVKMERDRQLIGAQLQKVMGDRAYVSWREVQLAYERDFQAFNPPGKARLRVIQAPMRDAERVQRVRAGLAAGEDFAAIATRESAFNSDKGGLHEVTLEGEYAETTIFGAAPLNDLARRLTPGQTSEPLEWNNSMFWLRFEGIEKPEGLTLYEAQLQLFRAIQSQRMSEEEIRYFNQLLARSSASDFDQMALRLERLAVERYMPGTQAAPAGSSAGSSGAAEPPRSGAR